MFDYLYRLDYRRLARDEERALWRRMRQGDARARQALIVSVLPWIVRVARRYAGADRQQLEELASEGYVCVCQAIDSFRPSRGRLTTYVAACLWRRYWRLLKQQARRPAWLSLDASTLAAGDESARAEEREQVVRDVQTALADLPTRDRQIVERRMQGDSLDAIRQQMQISKQRVHQIEQRACDRLRIALRDRYEASRRIT